MYDYRVGLLYLIVTSFPFTGAATNYYTITLPNKMHANSDYNVAATFHGIPGSSPSAVLNIVVTIRGPTIQPIQQASGTVSITPGTTKQLTIKIGDWEPGNYAVTATGSGTMTFSTTETVTLITKYVTTFIQTDKGWYQPSQLVQFRVVLVDSNLIPYQAETLMVQIKDPHKHIIQQWKNALLEHGVFQESLQLSEQPVIGDWSITTQVGSADSDRNKTNAVTFTVEEYVLPQFEVTIDTPYVTFEGNNDPTFTITVNAKYTFGGPVDGTLDLTINMIYCPYPFDSLCNEHMTCYTTPVNVKIPIKGTAKVPLKASDLYKSSNGAAKTALPWCVDQWEQQPTLVNSDADNLPAVKGDSPSKAATHRNTTVSLLAVVTEGLTGKQENRTAAMTIYAKDKMVTITNPPDFKPGMSFQVTVKLTRQDGFPIANSGGDVTLSLDFSPTASTSPKQTKSLSLDGVAVFTVVPPLDANYLTIMANYQSLKSSTSINAVKSKSNKYITVNIKTPKPVAGQKMDLEVRTTFAMNSPVSYVVVGRGNIRASGTIATSGQTQVTFSVVASGYMAPHARIVVYYIDSSSGEMIADSIDVDIAGSMRTPITLTTNTDTLAPGADVVLNIKTRPDSLVALHSVDMSVLLLDAGNDITQAKVFNELQVYDIGDPVHYENYFFAGTWRRPNYGKAFKQLFLYAGLILITNGQYYVEPPPAMAMAIAWLPEKNLMGGGGGGGRMVRPVPPIQAPQEFLESVAFAKTADAAVPETQTNVEPNRIRTYFPETFIWSKITAEIDGTCQVTYSVPDTITTWVINAFAINDDYGLGIMDSSKNITVYRKFFIVLDLPYSVVRNEIVTLKVLVFNYQSLDSQVEVTLKKSVDEYKIINQADQSQITITQLVPANGASIFRFTIQPTHVGQINLNVKATSLTASDAIIKQLLVKSEGSTEYYSKAVLIDMRGSTVPFTSKIKINIPVGAIPFSEYIEFTANGDFMAPILTNVNTLIRLPYGCGEQNMIHFVPNVVVMIYLQSTYMLTNDAKSMLLNYMIQGYQRELTYRHTDGSFSAFGMNGANGSTWLTAFVVKSFNLARPFITIDSKVITEAKNFLVKQQKATGEFFESGNVIHKELQGGSATGVGLTAFCLIAFLEDKTQDNALYQLAIDKSVAYLENRLETIDSTYEMSIVTYALQLAPKSLKKENAFSLLQTKRTQSGGLIYWQTSLTKFGSPTSYDIEATSYALLSYSSRTFSNDIQYILRWMVSQRTSLGGYSSSQDTVIGIQAMATFAISVKGADGSTLTIETTYDGTSQTYNIDDTNALVTQKTPLPKTVRTVDIKATGNGVGIAQVSWNYNVINNDQQQYFQITYSVAYNIKPSYILKVCARYLGKDSTNMVLYEVTTLSGYKWDKNNLPNVGTQQGPKQVDVNNGDTLAIVYFYSIPATDTCILLNAISSCDITNLQDAKISVYDYYNTFKKGEAKYNLPK